MRPTWNDRARYDDDPSSAASSHVERSASHTERESPAPVDTDPEVLGHVIEQAGRSLRIDAAHPADEELPADVELRANLELNADAEIGDESTRIEVSEPSPAELLARAEELAETVRRQCGEIERRERNLHRQMAQLDSERRATRLWRHEFEELCVAREAELSRLETELLERSVQYNTLETDLAREREAIATEWKSLADERSRLETERIAAAADLEAQQQRLREEWRAERGAQLEELASRTAEVDAEALRVERFRADVEAEVSALREAGANEIRQERALLESRLQFQKDHLDKTRIELEQAQTEFRWEQQAARVWLENELRQSRLLRGQLDGRRDLLDERERSIEREREMLLRTRRAQEDSLSRERERLTGERERWERERDVARADLRRQQDLLALHAENLETRRQRLDKLRAELEETNRTTLETRLAVEEACAQLARSAGVEETRTRVEEARAVLAEYYRHTRDSLIQQRRDVDEARGRILQQRDELKAEREALAAWGIEREREGAERETALAAAREELDQREREARQLREIWLAERREAETVIRDLLDRLEPPADPLSPDSAR